MGVRHTPTHSALPNWREPVAHPLTTRMSSNLGFRVINPLASPNLGGTSCASDRVGWPNLSFPRTRRQAGSGSAQSLRARHAHLLFSCPKIDRTAPTCAAARLWGDPGKRPSRWPTPAETQRRELRGEAPAVKGPARFCAALSGRASRESTRYSSQDAAGFY